MTHPQDRPIHAALLTLIILQLIMLASLFAGIPPHPPEATPLFGIGPFIGVAVAVPASAMILGPGHGAGRFFSLLAVLLAAISFGPQKYLDPQFPLIWPAVITGQIAIVTVVVMVVRGLLGNGRTVAASG